MNHGKNSPESAKRPQRENAQQNPRTKQPSLGLLHRGEGRRLLNGKYYGNRARVSLGHPNAVVDDALANECA